MTLCIALRADDAITIYDENNPRSGVIITTIAVAEDLIAALNDTIAELRAEQEQRRTKLRAAMTAMEQDEPPHVID